MSHKKEARLIFVNNEIIYTPFAGARDAQDDMEGINGSSCQLTPIKAAPGDQL